MDREHFDALTRLASASGSRRHALAILTAGLLLNHDAAVSLLAGSRKRKGKGKRRGKASSGDVVVCHSGEQLRVPPNAVRGVLLDGGTLGPCLSPPTCLGVNERTDSQCTNCCSNGCGRSDNTSSEFFCFVGVEGDPCHDSNDCSIPVGKCVTFRCT